MTTLRLYRLRIAHPSDRPAVQRFLQRLSPATVRWRYMSAWSTLSGPALEREIGRLLDRDPDRHVVVLALDGSEIRGIGEFVVDGPGRAEVALLVEDAFQHRGIGRRLFRHLRMLARRRGISVFTAEVASSNVRVQSLFRGASLPRHAHFEAGQLRYTMWLDAEAAKPSSIAS
jgi:ribosomal protein S18 acetylase RimI-like enzyme